MKSRPLFLFYIFVVYVFLQFGWWSYLLVQQDNEIYRLKSEINLLHHEDPQLIIERGNELEKKLHARWLMIAGEGAVFLALLLAGFILVRNTFRKEAALILQQKNFLHSVTHELKSPLASARLQLETLLKHDLPQKKRDELVSNALHDTQRLEHLVENILLAAIIENNTFELYREKVNLSEELEKILKQITHLASPMQKLEHQIQSGILFNMDKTYFSSIVVNLVENAIKYSSSDSAIKIILSEKEEEIFLSVNDEGAGVPEEEKENIFKKFYRIGNETTRSVKGTGLGLYIVKELVQKHGGHIAVKNNIPKGTIFEARFVSVQDANGLERMQTEKKNLS